MHWTQDYQLILFDFDGLLVNTEQIHFEAYKRMFAARGHKLDWTFARYCLAAHYEATALRDDAYRMFEGLTEEEPSWDVLYAEKKAIYSELLREGHVELMPGVDEVMEALAKGNTLSSVVTNSPPDVVGLIREQLPQLEAIPHWITREQYSRPKPDPECYSVALETLAKEGDRVIGLEDTVRGMRALSEALASSNKPLHSTAVLIAEDGVPGAKEMIASAPHPIAQSNSFLGITKASLS